MSDVAPSVRSVLVPLEKVKIGDETTVKLQTDGSYFIPAETLIRTPLEILQEFEIQLLHMVANNPEFEFVRTEDIYILGLKISWRRKKSNES